MGRPTIEPKLLTCPFCGKPPCLGVLKKGWLVECETKSCSIKPSTGERSTKSSAVLIWNKRKKPKAAKTK